MVCPFGTAPSTFNCLPVHRVMTSHLPAANIMDHIPLLNIPPFGLCTSLANPVVAAATAAAMGVLTPMPCIPATPAPWTPGSTSVLVDYFPALNNQCVCNCLWCGVIRFVAPAQTTEFVP